MKYLPHIAGRALNCPILLLPSAAVDVVAALGSSIGIDGEAARALALTKPQTAAPAREYATPIFAHTDLGVAIIQVKGTLINRSAFLESECGLTSYDTIKRQLRKAAYDPKISSIILDVDSPGGEAAGAMEAAAVVREVAARKPVVAVINALCASAAYIIISGATKIVSVPSAMVGSIGVVCIHTDISRQLEARGIRTTMIFAGEKKTAGNSFQALSEETRKDIQAEIDAIYEMVLACVASGRKSLTSEAVRATEARVYLATDAIKLGLVDEIGSFESIRSSLEKLYPATQNPGQRHKSAIFITPEDLDRARAEGAQAAMAAVLAGRPKSP